VESGFELVWSGSDQLKSALAGLSHTITPSHAEVAYVEDYGTGHRWSGKKKPRLRR